PRDKAAERVSHDKTWMSRAESGRLAPSVAEVEILLNFYGLASDSEECQRLLQIAREARKRSAQRVPELLRAYYTFEADAVEIRQFGIDLVPGLLQTEEYARAVITAMDPTRDPAEIDRLVSFRSQRQVRLTDDDPLRLLVVLDEAALRRVVGDPEVMRGQLDRLLKLATLPNVSIQVLPYGAGVHAAMGAPFSVLRLVEPGGQVVYLENLSTTDVLDRADEVTTYEHAFDRLTHAALDRRSATEMIEKAAGDLR
ncbi:MAG: DUF5753 domain-containing protein, partial [Pseudonocardia sp.]